MKAEEALKLVRLIIAAYPSWSPTLETQRLYAAYLAPLPYDLSAERVEAIIKSPREFAPPVGLIISTVEYEMEMRERQRKFLLPKKYQPGERRVAPSGTVYVADAEGDLIAQVDGG